MRLSGFPGEPLMVRLFCEAVPVPCLLRGDVFVPCLLREAVPVLCLFREEALLFCRASDGAVFLRGGV